MDHTWRKQRVIIRELIENILVRNNMSFSYETAAWLFCVKRGKTEGWFGPRCKRPNGVELQAIGETFNLSAEWLLYNKEPVFIEEKKSITEINESSSDYSSVNQIIDNIRKLMTFAENLDSTGHTTNKTY